MVSSYFLNFKQSAIWNAFLLIFDNIGNITYITVIFLICQKEKLSNSVYLFVIFINKLFLRFNGYFIYRFMYNQQIFLDLYWPFPVRSNCFCEMMDWDENFKNEFIRKKFAHFSLLYNWNSLVLVSIVIKLGILFSPPAKQSVYH